MNGPVDDGGPADGDGPAPIVGILGGMGPAASADFFAKVVAATPARTDQDHLRVLLWSDPLVPDRSEALLHHGPDPTARLLHGARLLVAAGARLIAVPCNTAHAFLGPIERLAGVEIIHMIDVTARHVAALDPPVRRAGLLATTGTVHAGLYQTWLAAHDVEVVLPTAHEQERVAQAIRWVKSGRRTATAARAIAEAGERLVARGAQALIAGCTEIPLVFGQGDAPVPVIDPTRLLAEAVVATATERRRSIAG
jgi:aspartate racemase